MLYKDFFQFFYAVTVNYTKDKFYLVRIPEQIPDETWGVSRLVIPQDCEMAFLSVFQMNQKFFDPEEDFMDVTTTQKIDNQMSLGEQLLAQNINDQVVLDLKQKNNADAYKDKGPGVLLPPEPEEFADEEHRQKFAQKDLEYPDLQLIVCRKGRILEKREKKEGEKEDEVYKEENSG